MGIYSEIAERIRSEIDDLEQTVDRILKVWSDMKKAPVDQSVYIDSVALNLHGFYSALEKLFELILRNIDKKTLPSKTWHQDLLKIMSQSAESVRPAVISNDTYKRLDKFLRFRHLVRNIYATNLIPQKIELLIEDLGLLWPNLRRELLSFAGFLERLNRDLVKRYKI